MDDGAGQEMWRTVEDFADHQEVWLEELGTYVSSPADEDDIIDCAQQI